MPNPNRSSASAVIAQALLALALTATSAGASRAETAAEPSQTIAQPPAPAFPDTTPPDEPPAPAPAAPSSQQRKRFADWTTIRDQSSGRIVCFALAKPRPANGSSRDLAAPDTNDGTLFYVTSWPQAGIKAEISVRMEVPFAAGATARLTIGSEAFTMAAQNNLAFVENPIQELKALDAMKKSGQMTLSGQTQDGVARTDTFSLNGFAAALGHVTQGCP